MKELIFTEKKDMREQAISRIDVLDKVKELFLIPEIDMMTIRQVADYYEVDVTALRMLYTRNKDEIDSDGSFMKRLSDFSNASQRTKQDVTFVKNRTGVTYTYGSGCVIVIPNCGIRCFSKRAVLRIGMLLRDSIVAKEVRTQLLNVFDRSSSTQKTEDLDNEKELWSGLYESVKTQDTDGELAAKTKLIGYYMRHNDMLKTANQMLAADILKWSNRATVNKAVRTIAGIRKCYVGMVWNELYTELRYKHGIGLSMRGKNPLIQHVEDQEWQFVQQSLAAICETNGIDVEKVMRTSLLD